MKTTILVIVILIIAGLWFYFNQEEITQPVVTNFEECLAAGNPIMESYPRQCRHNEEVFTEEIEPIITKEEALIIAQKSSDCSMAGVLTDEISYNAVTRTWWIDLERMPELEKDGCHPACVVGEETKRAEVNWRCTGLLLPE